MLRRKTKAATPASPSELPPKAADPDPRLELVLDQVLRGLALQQGALDNLRARAGTLVATASLVSTVFGATALADSANPPPTQWVVLAFLALFLVVAASIVMVWPYRWRWGIDGHRLLADYVEADPPASLDETRRSLAYYIQEDIDANERKFKWLWLALRVAVLAIGAEVSFWLAALGTR